MATQQEIVEYLRSYRDNLDSDNIKLKQQIKKKLLNDQALIHVLHNKELEEADAEPSDYYGVNILPFYILPDTQTEVQNFVCFETNNEIKYSMNYNNSVKKTQQIMFYILVNDKNALDEETSLARHDLLAAIIQTLFNYEIFLGGRFVLVSDKASVTDTHYLVRTLLFQQDTDNNLVKTINGKPKIVNHSILCEPSIPN